MDRWTTGTSQRQRKRGLRLVLFAFVMAILPGASLAACPVQEGALVARATYYSLPGQNMANGQQFDPNKNTVATPQDFFPLGTRLLIVNRGSGTHVIVEVTDRMPKKQRWRRPNKTHITTTQRVDLTPRSARTLGIYPTQGVACVEVRPLKG